MSKMLHIVKEARGGYQIRESGASGEGAGAGRVIECSDLMALAAGLRERGCSDKHISQATAELETADNAEIRI